MHAWLLVWPLLAAGCFLAPSQKPSASAQSRSTVPDPFPPPKSGLTIAVSPGEETSLAKLLDEFSQATGQNLVISRDASVVLKNSPTGLNRSVDVPAHEVYPFVESLLVHNGYAMAVLNDRDPRLLGVYNVQGPQRDSLRDLALFVPAERLAGFARHPAVLVTTMVDLPSTDVRTLSNAMRSMLTDANTQQIIPVGNTNSLVILGYGPAVADMVTMLRACDESARIAGEKQEKEKTADRERRAQEAARKPTVVTPAPKDEKPD